MLARLVYAAKQACLPATCRYDALPPVEDAPPLPAEANGNEVGREGLMDRAGGCQSFCAGYSARVGSGAAPASFVDS